MNDKRIVEYYFHPITNKLQMYVDVLRTVLLNISLRLLYTNKKGKESGYYIIIVQRIVGECQNWIIRKYWT